MPKVNKINEFWEEDDWDGLDYPCIHSGECKCAWPTGEFDVEYQESDDMPPGC